MNTAHRLSPSSLYGPALASASIPPRAEAVGQAAPSTDSFETVNKECASRLAKAWKRRAYSPRYDGREEEGRSGGKAFRFDKPSPPPLSPALPRDRREEPEGSRAIEALEMTLQTSYGPKDRHRSSKLREGHQDPSATTMRRSPQIKGRAQDACPALTTTIPRRWSPT